MSASQQKNIILLVVALGLAYLIYKNYYSASTDPQKPTTIPKTPPPAQQPLPPARPPASAPPSRPPASAPPPPASYVAPNPANPNWDDRSEWVSG